MTEQEMFEGFSQGRSLVQVWNTSTADEIAAVDRFHIEGVCFADEWTYTHPRHPAERARNVRGLARSTLPPENPSVAEVLRQNGRLQTEVRASVTQLPMNEADDMARRGALFAGQAGGLGTHRARAQMAENERRQARDALTHAALSAQFMGSVLEAGEPAPAQTWQPMQTAPRGRDIVVLMWCFTVQGMTPILASFYTRQLGAEPAWHGYSHNLQHMIVRADERYWRWMPLPPPPTFVSPDVVRGEPSPEPTPAPFPRRTSRRMLG